MDEHARAEVVDERQAVPPRHRCELFDRGLLGEADDAEVRLVHPQQDRRLRPDRALVVGRARAVRRPDLAQPRARAREHVGDPEAVADLDQLAARDEHLAPLGQRGQGEQHRRSVVVHDERGLGAGQPAQDRRHVVLTRAAPALGQVVLQVRVAAPDLERAGERSLGERRAPEVRVDDHPGRIQGPAQGRGTRRRQLAESPLDEVAGVVSRLYLFARAREGRAGRLDRERRRRLGCEPLVPRQLVHGGQVPQLHSGSV